MPEPTLTILKVSVQQANALAKTLYSEARGLTQ
jgi:hypothetical protein